MSKTVKIAVLAGFLGLMAYVVWSSFGLSKVSCEVCMDFKGRSDCRTARGATREEAIQTAITNVCARITNGRTENILCGNEPPTRITCSP